ncbi:unnamed protein product [Adineta steineri]|uniref:Ninjurin-2 n=1 Tax=Adineta steineri TaxID=433720 RepID=A0A815WF35_9BILA|nr:unnamed protein product [Adineta steineri]CAF1659016.1 unnamed protein product [Adineta steineri]
MASKFSPRMYPETEDNIRPVPPVRAEFQYNSQEEQLLPPTAPPRMDVQGQDNSSRPHQNECHCKYNRYATTKTIGQGFFELALITSNAMQLRTLLTQKQRDGIWIASLVLVCLSILAQIGLTYLLIIIGKGDIENPDKQTKLEKYNYLALFITILISIMNVIINVFMSTTSPTSYLDAHSLEILNKQA